MSANGERVWYNVYKISKPIFFRNILFFRFKENLLK